MASLDLLSFLQQQRKTYYKEKAELESLEFKQDILKSILSLKDISDYNDIGAIGYLLGLIFPKKTAEEIAYGLTVYFNNITRALIQINNNGDSPKNDDRRETIEENRAKINKLFDSIEKKCNEVGEELFFKVESIRSKSSSNYNNKLIYIALRDHELISRRLELDLHKQLAEKTLETNSGIDESTGVHIHEEIRRHNMTLKAPDMVAYDSVDIMMDEEFDKLEITDEETEKYNSKDEEVLKSFYQSLGTTEDIHELLEYAKSYYTSNNEFVYILKRLINFQIDEILVTKSLMFENYMIKDERKSTLSLNKDEKKKLSDLYEYYYKAINQQIAETPVHIEDETEEINNNKNILFLDRGVNRSTYFENDLKDIPEQKYEEVKYLLNGLKTNTLLPRRIRNLVNHTKLKGLLEARGDQIRVLFKMLPNDTYLIIGVGLKKDDADYPMYLNIAARYNPNEDYSYLYENKDEDMNRIIDYIDNNKRIGSR